jgi:hypothetical protein
MAHQLLPPSGREDKGSPWLRAAGGSARPDSLGADLSLHSDLGVRDLGVWAGESDPGRMLAWVLLIVVAAVVGGVLALVLWLV